MAESLGDVYLGLGADTSGLDKAITRMIALEKKVNEVVRAQVDGNHTAVRAWNAQEKAVRSALLQTVALHREIRAAGGEQQAQLLSRSTNALRGLTTAMSKGQLNVVDFSRANDKFRHSLKSVKSQLDVIKPPNNRMARFNSILRELQASAVLAVGPLSGVGARLSALSALTSRTTIGIAAVVAGATAMTVALYKLSAGAISARMEMDKINSTFEAAFGDAMRTRKEFEFVTSVARKYGLSIQSLAKNYAQLSVASKGTSLEGKKTRDIFESIAIAARAMNLTADNTQGIFKAVIQMMSKGTIQAEELRGQLGDQLVGAMRLMAEATGKSTRELDKLMKKGALLSEEELPKLFALVKQVFEASADKASGGLAASLENLRTSAFLFSVEFDNAANISQRFQNVVDALTASIDFMTNHMGLMGNVIAPIIGLLTGAAVGSMFGPWGALAGAVIGATGAFSVFNTVFSDTDAAIKATQQSADAFITAQEKMQTATKQTTQIYIDEVTKQIEVALTQAAAMQEKLANPGFFDKMFAAFKDVNKSPLQNMRDELNGTNTEIDKLLATLIRLREVQDKARDEGGAPPGLPPIEDKYAQRQQEVIDQLGVMKRELQDLDALPDVWYKGTESLERYKKALDDGKAIEAFEDKLRKANFTQEESSRLLQEYIDLLPKLDAGAMHLKTLEEQAKRVDAVVNGSLDNIGDNILKVIDGTQSLADAFGNMVTYLHQELTKLALQIAIIDPMKKAFQSGGGMEGISGSIGSFIAGFFSKGGYSTSAPESGSVPMTAFSGVPHFDRGGLTGGGIPAVLHDDEAVVPLPDGRKIPVEMKQNAQQPIVVNYYIQTPDANSFQKSKQQIMAQTHKALSRSAARNN